MRKSLFILLLLTTFSWAWAVNETEKIELLDRCKIDRITATGTKTEHDGFITLSRQWFTFKIEMAEKSFPGAVGIKMAIGNANSLCGMSDLKLSADNSSFQFTKGKSTYIIHSTKSRAFFERLQEYIRLSRCPVK